MSAQSPQLVQFDFAYTDDQGNSVTGSTVLDASVSEQHTIGAEVTRHQVEKGSDTTDHIRALPQKVSIEGVVTNTPIAAPLSASGITASFGAKDFTVGGQKFTAQVLQFSEQFDRVLEVYGDLVRAASFGALVTVTTTLHTYQNMAISNFGVPRNAGLGNALRFSIDFSEIRIVETTTVAALPSEKKKIKNGGDKPAKAVDSATEPKKASILDKWFGSAAGK